MKKYRVGFDSLSGPYFYPEKYDSADMAINVASAKRDLLSSLTFFVIEDAKAEKMIKKYIKEVEKKSVFVTERL